MNPGGRRGWPLREQQGGERLGDPGMMPSSPPAAMPRWTSRFLPGS
jgi:hypothetical protein